MILAIRLGDVMGRAAEIASFAWNYKLSLLPVLLTYLIFDLPAIVRRMTRVAYVPIYFIVFPSGHSDQLYAQYFNEDFFYGEGAQMSADEKRRLRHKIQATAIFSMVFATVVAPWLCGFIAAFYLSKQQFAEFVIFLLVAKTILIFFSLRRLKLESPAMSKGGSVYYVTALYSAYLFFVWLGLSKAYEWTHTHLNNKGVVGLALGLLDYAYADIFINIIIVAAITWGATTLFTDPTNIERAE